MRQNKKEDYSWLKKILEEASKEVESWPAWMKTPEARGIYHNDQRSEPPEREAPSHHKFIS